MRGTTANLSMLSLVKMWPRQYQFLDTTQAGRTKFMAKLLMLAMPNLLIQSMSRLVRLENEREEESVC